MVKVSYSQNYNNHRHKNLVMFRIKAMVNANSEEMYEEAYKNFVEICEENGLSIENSEPLYDFSLRNWHNSRKDWVFFYRLKLPTFGTNTYNHLESFNNNLLTRI
jgi:hypothetical protein